MHPALFGGLLVASAMYVFVRLRSARDRFDLIVFSLLSLQFVDGTVTEDWGRTLTFGVLVGLLLASVVERVQAIWNYLADRSPND